MEKSENLEFNVDHQLHPLVTFRDVQKMMESCE